MKESACDREKEILAAARESRLDAEQAAHLAACQRCRDARLVSQWLRELARGEERRPPLPAAETIWRRSQARIRRRRQKWALAPVLVFQKFSWVAFLAAGTAFLLAYGPSLWHALAVRFSASGPARYLRSLTPSGLQAIRDMLIAAIAAIGIMILITISCWLGDLFTRRKFFAGRG